MDRKQLVCFLLVSLISSTFALPLWKVFCTQTPLFRGRADPIVDPGTLSQHSHKVWGGNNFGIGTTPVDPIAYYNLIRASKCTTCSITLDLSDYWIPDLYYQWPNGSFSLVPHGGLTIYYPSRGGYLPDQTTPDIKPFPKGLRMTSGSPWRRSYNSSKIADRAISYACLGGTGPETPNFPTDTQVCPDGLRAQVWFPMCWDGKNLDSADHQSHMSFPLQAPDGGDCPSTHPVRLPGVFFEILFDVNNANFPHGAGHNPFVWSCGDSTGYGLHGDFISGWDTDLVAAALADPKCDLAKNPDLEYGNNVKACPPMAPYVKADNPDGACALATPITTIEDLGFGHVVSAMPGCNPVTGAQSTPVTPCKTAQPAPALVAPTRRVVLKSSTTNQYLTIADVKTPLYANNAGPVSSFTRAEVFLLVPSYVKNEGGFNIISEQSEQYLTAPNSGNNPMTADRGSPSDWEVFFPTFSTDGKTVTIKANSNNKYLSVQSDSSIKNSATTAGDTETFYITDVADLTLATPPTQTVPTSGGDPPVEVYSPTATPSPAQSTTSSNGGSPPVEQYSTTSTSSAQSATSGSTSASQQPSTAGDKDSSAVTAGASFLLLALSFLAL